MVVVEAGARVEEEDEVEVVVVVAVVAAGREGKPVVPVVSPSPQAAAARTSPRISAQRRITGEAIG